VVTASVPEAVVVVDESMTGFESAASRDVPVANMAPAARLRANEKYDFILILILVFYGL
jgi:hypothetical protein